MSQDKSVSNATQEVSDETEETKFVPKDAYEKVTSDMHKYKSKMREYEASLAKLQADLKAREEAELRDKEQYKELFERKQLEAEEARKEAQRVREQYLVTAKKSALKQELGGKVRDEYLQFADLTSIAIRDDGSIDVESVRTVANDFRKQHGQLIPQADNAQITGQAPGSNSPAPAVDLNKMSAAELVKYYAQQKLNNH